MADPSVYPAGWGTNYVSPHASSCETVKAAPASGTSLYLDRVTTTVGANISVTLGAGETAGAVTTALFGPLTFAANQTVDWNLSRPVKGGDAATGEE